MIKWVNHPVTSSMFSAQRTGGCVGAESLQSRGTETLTSVDTNTRNHGNCSQRWHQKQFLNEEFKISNETWFNKKKKAFQQKIKT